MNIPQLKTAFLIALVLSIFSLTAWELYWRSLPAYYHANVEDDRNLWAEHRAKVETAGKEDVVIIGSSRTGFNFNTHVWKEVQGIQPINLSTNGKPPGPFLDDIVHNTDFKGTIIYGVTEFFLFSPNTSSRWKDANQWVDHYHKQTYAQKLGHFLAKPLQRNLVMLTASELNFYNDLDLKSLINRIPLKGRVDEEVPLLNFGYNDEDRNLIMFDEMTRNPDFAKKITDVWDSFLPYIPAYDEEVAAAVREVTNYYVEVIRKFEARGGKVIFIRHKSEPTWNEVTQRIYPKEKVWDEFVKAVECPTYYFSDYEFMSKHTLPDWSHMAAKDAKNYTFDMVTTLIKDGHLNKVTTN